MEKVPFGKRSNYPHMKPADVPIWERFIETFPDAYDEVAYDVAVGTGAPIPPGTPEDVARDFTGLTQRKIDVVGFNEGLVDIIEVKPRAGTNAFGQVKGYEILYKKFIDSAVKTRALVITDEETTDLELLKRNMGVEVIVVSLQ